MISGVVSVPDAAAFSWSSRLEIASQNGDWRSGGTGTLRTAPVVTSVASDSASSFEEHEADRASTATPSAMLVMVTGALTAPSVPGHFVRDASSGTAAGLSDRS